MMLDTAEKLCKAIDEVEADLVRLQSRPLARAVGIANLRAQKGRLSIPCRRARSESTA